jgi:hypothetical protein
MIRRGQLKNLEVGKDFSMNTSHFHYFHFTIDNIYEGESNNQKHREEKREWTDKWEEKI